MREDLPCEEPLPKLWSICLAAGGDLVDEGPYLEDFELLQPLRLGGPSRYWRVRGDDDHHHVLCETRFVLPESLAVPRLGRLRELLLREARLLDTLSHGCVVPLESGWLEQRTGVEDPGVGACTGVCCSYSSVGRTRKRARGVGKASESAPEEERWGGEECFVSSGCQGRCRGLGPNVRLPLTGDDGPHGETDVAASLLRSWVPLTLEDVDGDDNDEHQDEGGELAHRVGVRNGLLFGGFEQLGWGGDDETDWRGTAEPKSSAHRTTISTARFVEAENDMHEWETADNCAATSGERVCTCACAGRASTDDGGRRGFSLRRRERTLSMASYLLLPDWLPLSVWFETEFEPRTASSDEQSGDLTTRAVTAPDDWAAVWRQLLSMFVQVVRGVEHLHTQGLIHNNISPSSVWVALDGRCCVGNLSQAAPPGYRRPPPPQTGPDATGHHHFASPERRQGRRVGAKSDLFSLGVLMLEFWRNYTLSRGLEEICLVGDGGLVERIVSGRATAQLEEGGGELDAILVRSMLAEEPFDRPDCFEVVDSLEES